MKPMHPAEPKKLPPGWVPVRIDPERGSMWVNKKKALQVIATVEEHGGKPWAHVSIVHAKRIPKWDEVCYLKKYWLGEGCDAVSVLPNEEDYVNIHPRCLHLYAPMDGETGLPSFHGEILGVKSI